MEIKTISIPIYRDEEGKPVCAKNFDTGDVCKYLGSRRMGLQDVCMLGENTDVFRELIKKGHYGYIRPQENCQLWQETNKKI